MKFKAIRKLAKKTGDTLYRLWYELPAEGAIQTHMTSRELLLLHKLIHREKDSIKKAVEIGSYLGASSCYIAAALSESAKLVCIDTWGNQNMKYDENDTDADERDTYGEFQSNTRKYRKKIVEIRKWSKEAVHDVEALCPSINFFFIDGNHSYEGVKNDWDLYRHLLKKGSMVAFHDTGWAAGVKRLITEEVLPIAELLEKLPNLEIYRIEKSAQ